jgi:Protein of unknown function (DUF2934)
MSNSNPLPPGTAGANRVQPPTHGQIAALAFSLYLKHGSRHGHAEKDWLEAEKVLSRQAANPHASRHDDRRTAKIDTHMVEHPHTRDARHSPSRGEIRQMNTSRRPAARESLRAAE